MADSLLIFNTALQKLCNLQSLCKGYQVDTLDETCELLADTEEPQVDEFFHLFKLE